MSSGPYLELTHACKHDYMCMNVPGGLIDDVHGQQGSGRRAAGAAPGPTEPGECGDVLGFWRPSTTSATAGMLVNT